MLVLGRKVNEEIVLPNQGVVFSILEVRGDRVKVGISAPDNVQVYRREVWNRIELELGIKSNGKAVLTVSPRKSRETALS